MNKRNLAIIAVTAFLAVELIGGASDASAQLFGRRRARCCSTTTCRPTRVTLASRWRGRQQCCPTTTVACEQSVQTAACCETVAGCQPAPEAVVVQSSGCCQATQVSSCGQCCTQRASLRQRLRSRRCCQTSSCCTTSSCDSGCGGCQSTGCGGVTGCQGAGCGSGEGIEGGANSDEIIESPSDSQPVVPTPPGADKEA